MADRASVAQDVIDAFNERDLERLLHHLHPDYEATWPHGHLSGADAVAHESDILAAIPDLRLLVERVSATDDGALVEVRARGTHTGDWTAPDGEHLPASGREVDTAMAFVMVFEGELLRTERLYFDQQTLHGSLRRIEP